MNDELPKELKPVVEKAAQDIARRIDADLLKLLKNGTIGNVNGGMEDVADGLRRMAQIAREGKK